MRSLVTFEPSRDKNIHGISVSVEISKSGLPRMTVLFPTFGMFSNVDDRAVYLANCVDELTLIGWYVIRSSIHLVRNPFDKPGEKTTLSVTVRPCKNESEAAEIISFITQKKINP